MIGGIVAGLSTVLALGAGGWGVADCLRAHPLVAVSAGTAERLQQGVANTELALTAADGVIAYVTGAAGMPVGGVGAAASEASSPGAVPGSGETATGGPASAAGQAYAATWLAQSDAAVQRAMGAVDGCRAQVASARAMLDPAQVLIGWSDQTDSTSRPRVASLGDAVTLRTALGTCPDALRGATEPLRSAAEGAKAAAALQVATGENQAARTTLQASVATAQSVYDASAGHVFDDAVRGTLAEQLAGATVLLAAAVPADWQAVDQQTAAVTTAASGLGDAAAAVTTAQADWEAKTYTGGNGRLNPKTLCPVPYDPKQLLRCDAEAAWMRLNAAYRAVWNEDIPIDLSYRTYDEQVQARIDYGTGAAVPGTSNHGWGIAVDLPDYRETTLGLQWNYGTPKYEWMKAHAPAYGWVNPSWAVEGGTGPHEPWHFEYTG